MWTALMVLSLGFAPADWFTYEPDAKNFRLELPSKPNSTSTRTIRNSAGQARLTTVELRAVDATYTVQVTEAAREINTRSLDDGIHRFAASRHAALEDISNISLENRPGREFTMTEIAQGGDIRVKARWFITDKALFVLTVAASPGRDLPADANRFLASLRFTTPKPAKPANESKLATSADNDSPTVVDANDDDNDAKPKADSKSTSSKPIPLGRITISRIPKNAKPYPEENLEDLGRRQYAKDRDGFRDLGPAGSVLVGFRATYIERFGGPKVRSLQPIYRSGKNYYQGRIYGTVVGPVKTVVARPGYAIGGLVTHTGLTLDGFGIVFMKVDGDRLDIDDTYKSSWIGDRNGGNPDEVATKRSIIVGIQGRAGTEVNGLSLIGMK
jgi:hypothetical protein